MSNYVLYLVTRSSALLPAEPTHLPAETSIILLHGANVPHSGAHVYQLRDNGDPTPLPSSPQVISHKDLLRMVFEASRVVVL